jgi:hypothetical protein
VENPVARRGPESDPTSVHFNAVVKQNIKIRRRVEINVIIAVCFDEVARQSVIVRRIPESDSITVCSSVVAG